MSRSGLRAPALAMLKRRRMQIESVRTTFIDPLLSHHGIKAGSAIGLRRRTFPASCMFGVIRDRGIKILHPANWIRGPLRAGYFRTSVARTLATLQQHHGYSLRLLDRNFGQQPRLRRSQRSAQSAISDRRPALNPMTLKFR